MEASPTRSVSSAQSAAQSIWPQCGQGYSPSFSNTMRSAVYTSVAVPTVERGLRFAPSCRMAMAGEAPRTRSTAGLGMPCIERASRCRRWHSVASTSTSRVDLPEPDTPVNTVILFLGMASVTSRRLPSRAPTMVRVSKRGPFAEGESGEPYTLPQLGHRSQMKHSPHFGLRAMHVSRPNSTHWWLMGPQYSRG